MTHLEERLEQDLNNIRQRVSEQARTVEKAVENAVHALQTGDKKMAYDVVINDHPINRAMREIDRLCHKFIAVHLPSGGNLRLLSSVIRVNIELERIGDYAVTIAREMAQIGTPPTGVMARELDRMSNETLLMLRQAIKAFNDLNADLARGTMVMAEPMEHSLDSVYEEMMTNDERGKVKDILSVFVVFTQLKRVADQAKNLCEDTVFAATGQQKALKVYRILFVDEDNSFFSQMARAIAAKHYPESGRYQSAGRNPAPQLSPAMAAFMGERGIQVKDAQPSALGSLTKSDLGDFHIIISLQGEVSSYVPEIPFHTAALDWDIGSVSDDASEQEIEAVYRDLAVRISDLMQVLRGDEAT